VERLCSFEESRDTEIGIEDLVRCRVQKCPAHCRRKNTIKARSIGDLEMPFFPVLEVHCSSHLAENPEREQPLMRLRKDICRLPDGAVFALPQLRSVVLAGAGDSICLSAGAADRSCPGPHQKLSIVRGKVMNIQRYQIRALDRQQGIQNSESSRLNLRQINPVGFVGSTRTASAIMS